jgi:hypothetical protein
MKVDQETQDAIKERLEAAGYFESGQAYPLNHGYCWSTCTALTRRGC